MKYLYKGITIYADLVGYSFILDGESFNTDALSEAVQFINSYR